MTAAQNDPIGKAVSTGATGSSPVPVLDLMRQVERGVPVSALDHVVQAVAPGDGAFAFRIVPKATLTRRRNNAPGAGGGILSQEEGGRVARVAEVWSAAIDVWKNATDARAFLFRAHPLLDGERPMDVVLANEFGRPVVLDILGRLKHGTAV